MHEILLPGNYSFSDLSGKMIEEEIISNIIGETGYSLKRTWTMHLKLLAGRSGLGKYGRNNICYVGEMGSFVNLMAFFTDYEFEEDNWQPTKMMEHCETCKKCISDCPGQAIPKTDSFVIDVERCISLYNEIPGVIPDWIPNTAHNALMGCMICQKNCPGNKKSISLVHQGGDITEEVTKAILDKDLTKAKEMNLNKRLPIYFFNQDITLEGLDLLKRNLELVLPS